MSLTCAAQPVYCLPLGAASLVYAPRHLLLAVVRDDVVEALRSSLRGDDRTPPEDERLRAIVARLREPPRRVPAPRPSSRSGVPAVPLFLGLVPTRGCTMACGYCGFAPVAPDSPVMSRDVAQAAVDGYLTLLADAGVARGEIHFFGGEPFVAMDLVRFVVEYATARASASGVVLHLEASTNGFMSRRRAAWVAERLDTVVVSVDGLPDVQDRQRPSINGRPTSGVVTRTIRMVSEGPAELILRACVTAESVADLPDWAAWVAAELRPSTVCLEPLTLTERAGARGLFPPDPARFARQFDRAARILQRSGIDTVHSTSNTDAIRTSACPLGRDALIVAPDGGVDACYLPEVEWRERGLDLRLGRVDVPTRRIELDPAGLAGVRATAERDKPLCATCFCADHCAGGCHVQHDTDSPETGYDDVCRTTRLVTVTRLLHRLRLPEIADRWLDDPAAIAGLAELADDRLLAGCRGEP